MPSLSPTLEDLKQQAKALRQSLERSGHSISHSQSLELIAHQYGHRDWNTLYAALGNRPAAPFFVGQQLSGAYLGKACSGEVIAVRSIGDGENFRLTMRFEEPVDIIEFESWSSFRSQINATVDRSGRTAEKTSNGQPHLVLNMD
jgi:hypothetical protein